MSTVMWDLDGVACLFVENFYPKLCEWNDLTPTEWNTWSHHHTHGISDADFVKHLVQYGAEGGFGDQKPVPGFREAVKQIHRAGHIQCVVTDRPESAHADTAWWVEEYAPEMETLDFSRDKTVFKKHGEPTYYAIDDRVENVEALRKAGVFAYLLTWPWNKASDLPRVATLQEFADIVTGGRGRGEGALDPLSGWKTHIKFLGRSETRVGGKPTLGSVPDGQHDLS